MHCAVVSPYLDIVDDIRGNRPSGMQELERIFSRGVSVLLARHLPPHVAEARVRKVLVAVEQAIQRGELADPEELTALVRMLVYKEIEDCGHGPVRLAPAAGQDARKVRIMTEILRRLPEREREAIQRFYLCEESEDRICGAVRISREQFRQIKSKVRQRFEERVAALPEARS